MDNLGITPRVGTLAAPIAGTVTMPTTAFVGSNAARTHVTGDDYAVFGQAVFHFDDTLSLRIGARGTRDQLKLHYIIDALIPELPGPLGVPAPVTPPAVPPFASFNYIGFNGPYVTPCFTPTDPAVISGTRRANCYPAIDQGVDATNFSWRVTVDKQFTPDVMGYLTAARGYKGPGFSGFSFTGAQLTAGALEQKVKPEIPTSYEAGLKSSFFEHRLVANIDVFMTEYKNFQAQVTTPAGIAGSSAFVARIMNAGAVHTKGVEVQLTAIPVQDLTIGLSATYLDDKYGDFAGVPCWAHNDPTPPYAASAPQPGCGVAPNVAGTVNARGNRLAGAPRFQSTISLAYDRPDLIGSLTGHFNLTWNWQSDINYLPNGDPFGVQKGFGLLGGRVGVSTDDGNLSLSIYGVNILDQRFIGGISPYPVQAAGPGSYAQYFTADSFRRVGISLDAKF